MSFLSRAPAPLPLAAPAGDGPGNPWFSWQYVQDNADTIVSKLGFHIGITVETVASRRPVTMPGSASGSSTCQSRPNRPYPMPAAASLTSADTWVRPVSALRTRSSSAYSTSAINTVTRLVAPSSGASSASRASDGIV